ncbi:uncharacterized protein N7473_010371 [Penicillium subrubescens]|uniref:uncharacterized protein n=1 Tax=Penicillium subrubescens TaxID=1316194 RepID=UPI0025452BEF|nr:uncharacterized protein N7473_010371 [Penicillium subrubescens]KAJ5883485.1 hypothetical protein N7473_010371 [Penicillium subrubescens]
MQALSAESDRWVESGPISSTHRVSRPWRLVTALSSALLLLGYLILAVVFGDHPEELHIDRTASLVFALFFIGTSYIASIAIAYFQRKRKLFLLRSLFMPFLVVNLVSLFNVLFNILSRSLFPLNAIRVIGIGLPSAFIIIYGLAAFLIYHEYGPSQGHRAEDGTPLLSQEEMQRRQLLRLLQEQGSGAPSPNPSQINTTYRLESVPGLDPTPKTWDPHLIPPPSTTWSSLSRMLETAAIRAAKASPPYLRPYTLFNVFGLATLFLKCDNMAKRVTLLDPPPQDHSKAPIENVLDLTPVVDLGPDVFTNTRPLWHPPGARGIYGGAAIAQSLSAAMRTVPSDFAVHSMHCYFVLAGDSEIPILYHVERVRDGRSFITRTVQARQRGRPIFTTTLSFSRVGSGGEKTITHQASMPEATLPDDALPGTVQALNNAGAGPFESRKAGIVNRNSPNPEDKKVRRFVRTRGHISEDGGFQAHLSALAYVTDSYFIGTVSRVHDIPRFSSPAELQRLLKALKNPSDLDDEDITKALKELKEEEAADLRRRLQGALDNATQGKNKTEKEVGMMVSLDHSIYFHNPRAFRADEWMLIEMESPWAGEGRGLAIQKIWSQDGTLIATCTQEGVVRLKQDKPPLSKI